MDFSRASSSQSTHHNSSSNCISVCKNDANSSLNLNLARPKFLDTFTIKVEQDVSESYDMQIRNDDTNFQDIKLQPQFCIIDENDLMEANHIAPGSNITIKTEVEDTIDELASNLHHVPFDIENLQGEDPLQNELTSEFIVKPENEWNVVLETTRDNENYVHDIPGTEREKSTKSGCDIVRQVDAEHLQCDVTQNPSYSCKICRRVIKHKYYFAEHLKLHESNEINDKGMFECKFCKMQFIRKSLFSVHKKIHLNKRPHKCLQCNKQFKTKDNLQKHIKFTHGTKKLSFQCRQCSKLCKSKKKLKSHVKVTHSLKCDICSKYFKNKSTLSNHMVVHTNLKPFQCKECDKKYKYKYSLQTHTKRIHTGLNLVSCLQCSKKFVNKSELINHQRSHRNERPFACDICNKTFKAKQYLKAHILYYVHPVEPRFKCEKCDKKFALQAYLINHMKSHSTEQPFQCKQCKKRYKSKSDLKKHMLIHTEMCTMFFTNTLKLMNYHIVRSTGYNFKCHLCNTEFKRKSDFEYHVQLHLKSNSCNIFTCNECEKSFSLKYNLQFHIVRMHFNSRQFKCDKCDKLFKCQYMLKYHSIVHSNVFPFKCRVCNCMFKRKTGLIIHMCRVHGENV